MINSWEENKNVNFGENFENLFEHNAHSSTAIKVWKKNYRQESVFVFRFEMRGGKKREGGKFSKNVSVSNLRMSDDKKWW